MTPRSVTELISQAGSGTRLKYLKFSQHKDLQDFLVGTGDRVLVEASPVDAICGIGLASDDPGAMDPIQWRGENLLGFALMRARQLIR